MSEAATTAAQPAKKPAPPAQIPFTFRLALGLLGILLAAMVAGLNNRVAGLALPDISGALGFGHDDASWLDTFYEAGELAAMPFSTWFAITFSLRRFHILMQLGVLVVALILPFVHDLTLLAGLRLVQGIFAGALIPMLMMSALRFLPTPIRLHGLALYAMTATLAPNVGVWLAAVCVDYMDDWRLVYWHIVPLLLISIACVGYGIPKLPLVLPRIRQANWLGMCFAIPGLMAIAVAFTQGVRLDWFNSNIICASMWVGVLLVGFFVYSEWIHPAPFMRIQLLGRRNLGLGFTVFFLMLVAMSSAVVMPVNILGSVQGFRMEQLAPLGLLVGVPQVFMGSIAALLLYRKWVDARKLFVIGLLLMAFACFLCTRITSEWQVQQFFWAQVLQLIGQPMAVVPLLFLGTSVVAPMEGPYVAGIINTLRAFGTVFAGGMIGEIMQQRHQFHYEVLLGGLGTWSAQPGTENAASFAGMASQQATILASADIYWLFMGLYLALIPCVLILNYIPAPLIPAPQKPSPQTA